MNNMIKGSIAGATGVALLMGGFGTYALWSDTGTLEDSEVTSGTLDVAPGAVSWQDQNAATWTGSDLMVPGDTVTRSQSFDFTATGKNMVGTIRFTPGNVTEFTGADSFSVDVAVTGVDGITGAGGCFEFTSADFSDTAVTTVTYALSADAQDLQGATASILDSSFVIEQGHTCS